MVGSLPFSLLIGTLLGFLSGLGIGGGSLLIIWLTVVIGLEPEAARSINLLFFIPSAILVCFLRSKNGTLQIRPLLPAMIAGCAAAGLFSWISTVVDAEALKKLFGVILIAAGLRETIYQNEK